MNEPTVIMQGLLDYINRECEQCPYSQDCYDSNYCEAIERARNFVNDSMRYDDKPF